MKQAIILFSLLFYSVSIVAQHEKGKTISVYDLRCEYLTNPLGIDTDVWDSEIVSSGQSHLVPYGGRELLSGADYYWKVIVYTSSPVRPAKENAHSVASAVARFSMGLLDPSDWKGDNSIALWYGPGWSRNGSFASKVDQAVLLQLAGKTKKGESFSLHSDESWKCAESYSRNSGRFQPMDMGGEEVDGRRYCTYGDKKIVEDAYESGKYRIIAE